MVELGGVKDWFEWLRDFEYRRHAGIDDFVFRSIIDRVVLGLGLCGGEKVLEFGAGKGALTIELARAIGEGGKVFALEVDPRCVRHLRERCEREGVRNVVLLQDDYKNFVAEGAEFQCFASRSFLSYVEDIHAAVRKIAKALERGGRFSVFEPLLGEARYVFRRGVVFPEGFLRLEESLKASGPPRSVDRKWLREAFSCIDSRVESLVVNYRFNFKGLTEDEIVREYLFDLPGELSAMATLRKAGFQEGEILEYVREFGREVSEHGAVLLMPCIFVRGRKR